MGKHDRIAVGHCIDANNHLKSAILGLQTQSKSKDRTVGSNLRELTRLRYVLDLLLMLGANYWKRISDAFILF